MQTEAGTAGNETSESLLTDTGGKGDSTDAGAGKQDAGAAGSKADDASGKADEKQTTADEQKPDAKGDEAKAKGDAPKDIELKLPEGVAADTVLLDEFKAFAKTEGLDSAKAQKVVDLYVKAVTRHDEAAREHWATQQQKWIEDAKADKEIGGNDFDQKLPVARKAIEKFGTPGLKTLFKELGLGNHPELVRFAYRVGKAIEEDSIARPTGAGAASDEGDLAKVLYPNSPGLK